MLMLSFSILLTVTVISEYTSFYKLKNLQNQKEIATTVYMLGRADLDLSNIQFRGKNALLRHESDALIGYYEFDYINNFTNAGTYQNEISKLQQSINDFNLAARKWYTQKSISEEELQTHKQQFTKAYNVLIAQINTITTQNSIYEEKRFFIQVSLTAILLVLILFSMFWTSRRLSKIEDDIRDLNTSDQEEVTTFATFEAESISKNMGRTTKTPTVLNPAYLDNVSGINSSRQSI